MEYMQFTAVVLMTLLTLKLLLLPGKVSANPVATESRWMMAAGTMALVLQFLLQLILGLRAMGVTQAAGLSLKWFRDNFCMPEKEAAAMMGVDPYDLMNREAEKSPIGSNRLLYAPYLMGERTPHLDSNCRGMFVGLSAMHTRRDLLRAVMEGVTFSLADCLGVLAEMGVKADRMLACGGGGRSPVWRQMLADVFQMPVATTVSTEGPALGVAILAGVGAGLYESVPAACDAMIHENPAQMPIAEHVAPYEKVYSVYRKLYNANREIFDDLAGL